MGAITVASLHCDDFVHDLMAQPLFWPAKPV
jgi:hypothetical protein